MPMPMRFVAMGLAVSVWLVGGLVAGLVAAPSGDVLSLSASRWKTVSDDATRRTLRTEAGALVIDFPVVAPPGLAPPAGSLNYLYTDAVPRSLSGRLEITLEIRTSTPPPFFNYATEDFNVGGLPANARPFLMSSRSVWSGGEFDRWWSNPLTVTLGPTAGTVLLSVPLIPSAWSSVYGRFGDADSEALAGWTRALASVQSLGLTFGGGSFFGHGVNIWGGTAQCRIVRYAVVR